MPLSLIILTHLFGKCKPFFEIFYFYCETAETVNSRAMTSAPRRPQHRTQSLLCVKEGGIMRSKMTEGLAMRIRPHDACRAVAGRETRPLRKLWKQFRTAPGA